MSPELNKAIETIKNIYAEYEEVCIRKIELEEKIQWIENNLLKGNAAETSQASASLTVTNKFEGKNGKEVYREIIKNYFEYRIFKEYEIREKATKEGLRMKGEPIKEVTSRSIIRDLKTEGFIETPNRGSYKQVKKEEQKEPEYSKVKVLEI